MWRVTGAISLQWGVLSTNRKLSSVDGGISPYKSASVELFKVIHRVSLRRHFSFASERLLSGERVHVISPANNPPILLLVPIPAGGFYGLYYGYRLGFIYNKKRIAKPGTQPAINRRSVLTHSLIHLILKVIPIKAPDVTISMLDPPFR